MGGRIVAIDSAAEHGDRRAARLERAAVRLGVDAARHARDDDETGARELPPERARDRRAVAGAGAGADDRDRGAAEELELRTAAHEETRRRIVDRSQQRRERGCRPGEEAKARARESLLVRARIEVPQVRPPAPPRRRAQEVRSGLGREDGECELRHAASSCRRAICERLGHVLLADAIGAGERGDRARNARDPRAASTGQRQPVDGTGEQLVGLRRYAGARAAASASRAADDALGDRLPTARPLRAASSTARGRGTVTTRSKRSSSARESLSR